MRGFFQTFRGPRASAPVGDIWRWLRCFAFPPHVLVMGARDIGVDRSAGNGHHCIRIGLAVSARCDAKIAIFRIHRPQAPIVAGPQPRDVITDGGNFPAIIASGWNEHGEIGFPTGRGESCSDVGCLALGIFDFHQQHVLGHPAFLLA